MAQKEPVLHALFQGVPNFFILFFNYSSKPSLLDEHWLHEMSTLLMWHLGHEDMRFLWPFGFQGIEHSQVSSNTKVIIVL